MMKQVQELLRELKLDDEGNFYNPQVRNILARFADEGDVDALEAASALRSAAHALERLRSRGAEGRGVSAGAMDILLRLGLGNDEAISITELAKSLGVSPRNVTGLTDTLERGGLVERTSDPHDRRSVLVQITPAGNETVRALRAPTQLAMSALFQDFTDADLAQFRHLCLRLVNHATSMER